MNSLRFHIFAIAALGQGLSGSDRIFIEFAKRLSKKNLVTIHVWREGYEMCKKQGLDEGVVFNIINVNPWCKFGFLICYFARIFKAVSWALFAKIDNDSNTVLYSASEFWMDSLPALILKIRFPKIKWVAAWFQTAPNPLTGFSIGERKNLYRLSAFYYWFMQLPIKPLIKIFADFILVNNEEEKKQFLSLKQKDKVIVLLGAVNVEEINSWLLKNNKDKQEKKYDAVFQGRFHPQKGVVELVEIWKKVTEKIPNARLAMIGDGPLMESVKLKIKSEKLENNIELFGYVFDGDKKYRIFSQSKIVVHPAFYDSGGMASAEAMAFGLPCIGFDLDSYKSYYPQGMIKVKMGSLDGFAKEVIELIVNETSRNRLGKTAQEMIFKNWSWEQRTNQLLTAIS